MIKTLNKKQLQHGDVLHCTSTGFIARVIQWLTNSRKNHTALVVELQAETFIIDSQANGTNLKTIENWNKKYNYEYEIHRKMTKPAGWDDVILNKALSKVGVTGYDFASLLIWQPWYILTGRWRGRKREKAEKRMYCSEFVAWVIGLQNWWKLSPQRVFEKIEKQGLWDLIK